VRFDVGGVDHLCVGRSAIRGELAEQVFPDAVSIGPVSGANSLLTGKITGKFRFRACFAKLNNAEVQRFWAFCAKFPIHQNREFRRENRESLSLNRERLR
jgi:hypothetical protein